jgi:hypothetical protein
MIRIALCLVASVAQQPPDVLAAPARGSLNLLPTAPPSRRPAMRSITKLLSAMSEFGDHLPASVVIYALVAVGTIVYAVWAGGGSVH